MMCCQSLVPQRHHMAGPLGQAASHLATQRMLGPVRAGTCRQTARPLSARSNRMARGALHLYQTTLRLTRPATWAGMWRWEARPSFLKKRSKRLLQIQVRVLPGPSATATNKSLLVLFFRKEHLPYPGLYEPTSLPVGITCKYGAIALQATARRGMSALRRRLVRQRRQPDKKRPRNACHAVPGLPVRACLAFAARKPPSWDNS